MTANRLEPLHHVDAGVLRIAYHEAGPSSGVPVLLMHGFPYDIHAYAEVVPLLVAQGCRAIVPYLRGFGATRFLHAATPRSGEQAALGADLVALLDALALPRAVLAGYDWGGRAACVVAALWPERCAGLLTYNSYNIQHIASALRPLPPDSERRLWYQYYFHSERGRAGLAADRRALCRLLWRTWSPSWVFDDATFERSALAFDNPDFVDVVIHSYRHRYGAAPGDPALEWIERRLAELPPITVPTVVLHGGADAVILPTAEAADAARFVGPFERHVVPNAGHLLPREAPESVVAAVSALIGQEAETSQRV